MDEFAHVHIGRLFDAVRAHYDGQSAPVELAYNCPVTVQYHVSCGMSFCGHWDYTPLMGGGVKLYERDYFCPRCGAHVEDGLSAATHDMRPGEDYVPINMDLQAKAYKHYLDIVIRAQTVYLNLQRYQPSITQSVRPRKWRIRFDFLSRQTMYRDYQEDTDTPIWPFGALADDDLHARVRDTVLGYLHTSMIIQGNIRADLDHFMTLVAQRFRALQEEHVQHKVISPYTPTYGRPSYGVYNKPVSNLIWRLAAPDARNLRDAEYYMCGNDRGTRELQRLLDLTREGLPYLEAVRLIFRIPAKKAINRVLVQADLLDLPAIHLLCRTISNYDLATKACATLINCGNNRLRSLIAEYAWTIRWLDHVKGSGEAYKAAIMLLHIPSQVTDSVQTYKLLTHDNKRRFLTGRWSVKSAHDQLLALWHRQEYANRTIVYSANAKRLPAVYPEMGISICLPPDTDNLRALGHVMHNCAGTYCRRVITRETVVLGAFDSNNTPQVCLEVAHGDLIQAKLACNKRVSTDPRLEEIIIHWAEDKGLRISTIDITQERRRAGA